MDSDITSHLNCVTSNMSYKYQMSGYIINSDHQITNLTKFPQNVGILLKPITNTYERIVTHKAAYGIPDSYLYNQCLKGNFIAFGTSTYNDESGRYIHRVQISSKFQSTQPFSSSYFAYEKTNNQQSFFYFIPRTIIINIKKCKLLCKTCKIPKIYLNNDRTHFCYQCEHFNILPKHIILGNVVAQLSMLHGQNDKRKKRKQNYKKIKEIKKNLNC